MDNKEARAEFYSSFHHQITTGFRAMTEDYLETTTKVTFH